MRGAADVAPDFRDRLERFVKFLYRPRGGLLSRASAIAEAGRRFGVSTATVTRWLAGFAPEPIRYEAAEDVLRRHESRTGGSHS